jgi:hypothetical protein
MRTDAGEEQAVLRECAICINSLTRCSLRGTVLCPPSVFTSCTQRLPVWLRQMWCSPPPNIMSKVNRISSTTNPFASENMVFTKTDCKMLKQYIPWRDKIIVSVKVYLDLIIPKDRKICETPLLTVLYNHHWQSNSNCLKNKISELNFVIKSHSIQNYL